MILRRALLVFLVLASLALVLTSCGVTSWQRDADTYASAIQLNSEAMNKQIQEARRER